MAGYMMGTIDRKAFFDGIRPLYGGSLTQAQIDTMDPALTAFEQAFGEYGEECSICLTNCWIIKVDMILSDRGSQVLVDREGLRTTAYQDSVGVWTIGVGHTAACGPPEPCAGMTITTDEAFAIFDRDNNSFEKSVNDLVTVPLTQYEFDALVSFAYNVGAGAFADSTMLKKLNAGDKAGAFYEFKNWDIPPEIIPRRRGEAACFGYNIYVARVEDDDPLLAEYKSGELGQPAV
jgi:lysozyme